MIGRILLYGKTIKHLKFKQIYYQVYNRLKLKSPIKAYIPQQTHISHLNFTFNPVVKIVTGGSKFNFLNLSKQFDSIDWNFNEFGKLWNYNLQYFNYLQQPDISVEIKKQWLYDIGDWLISNNLKAEPYPISLRIINVIRFLSENKITDERIQQNIYAQATYLGKNIEYHILGNHVLENAFALITSGCFFDNSKWMDKGRSILYKELNEQVLKDGAHFELSPMYHQLILFRVLELIDWYGKTVNPDVTFLNFLKNKAASMLGWLSTITFNNGTIPYVNDATESIAPTTSTLLQFAQLLNINPHFTKLADSGYRKFISHNYECLFDIGQIGPSYQPGHSHADTFSFIVQHTNKPLISEAGTSTYQLGSRRAYERSTAAHNTVVINNTDQSEVWDGFRVGNRANVNLLKDTDNIVIAEHDGYKARFNAIHNRSFMFNDSEIIIKDTIKCAKRLQCKAYFHFYPGVIVKKAEKNYYQLNDDTTIFFKGNVQIEMNDFECAMGYNSYKQGKVLIVAFDKELQSIISFK